MLPCYSEYNPTVLCSPAGDSWHLIHFSFIKSRTYPQKLQSPNVNILRVPGCVTQHLTEGPAGDPKFDLT